MISSSCSPMDSFTRDTASFLEVASPPLTTFYVGQRGSALPLEVEHNIIEHLRGDYAALKMCALASRDWSSLCQRYLFQGVRAIGTENLDDIASLFRVCPDIRDTLEVLTISGEGYSKGAVVHLSALMSVITCLPKLRELQIVNLPLTFDTNLVDPSTRQSVAQLRLISEACRREDFLCMMSIVSAFTRIEEVQLTVINAEPLDCNLDAAEYDLPRRRLPEHLVQIDWFKTRQVDEQWFPILLASLRAMGALAEGQLGLGVLYEPQARSSLPATIEDHERTRALISGYGGFLRSLGSAVRQLDLSFLHSISTGHIVFAGKWDVLGLSACPNLQRLSLYLNLAPLAEDAYAQRIMTTALDAYADILAQNELIALRMLTLHIAVETEDSILFEFDWRRLDEAIARLPALQVVWLVVRYLTPAMFTEPFYEILPRTNGAKVMLFSCSAPRPSRETAQIRMRDRTAKNKRQLAAFASIAHKHRNKIGARTVASLQQPARIEIASESD
ncbi:hypothetical protein C8Q74DRAFT_20392 [Fomes fomentarius]|nr:hypothetical protein C8Q74DRAFT_20392 [Fomes fomentarius]